MSKWNGKRFSVYTSEEKTTLGLIKELGEQTNFNTEEVERIEREKTDLYGDHKGTWQGYRPSQVDAAITSILDEHTSQLAQTSSELLRRGVNVMDFGAIGDGVADDTAAIQNAIDYLSSAEDDSPFVGGDLILPFGHKFNITSVTINTPNVRVRGGGVVYNGSIFLGAKTGGQNNLNVKIEGIIFEHASLSEGNIGIELGKVRIATIENCTFINCDKSIYVAPNEEYGFHDISQIKIFKNYFQNVNYNVFVELFDDFSTNYNRWMTCSDWQYFDNISNLTFITPIWLRAMDGINISHNIFFHSSSPALRERKEKGIYIGESDWVTINENHIFVTGFEAIHLHNPNHFIIADNEIAWCGQREPRSSILVSGNSTIRGNIHDNNISLFTLHAISLENKGYGHVAVKNNVMDYSSTSSSYCGNIELSNITHYKVNQILDTSIVAIVNGNECFSTENILDNVKKRYGSSYKTTMRSHFAGTVVTQSIPSAATTYNLVKLRSVTNNENNYDGLLYVNARLGDLDSTNTASYLLHVSKTSVNVYSCIEISKAGLTSGLSTNHPSFNFSIDPVNNLLKVTGVGSTQGNFTFYITQIGNIQVIK